MKTASVKGPSIISVDETEKPVLNSGDILVQMHACGICGSDLEKGVWSIWPTLNASWS